jgi:hypothetical protein
MTECFDTCGAQAVNLKMAVEDSVLTGLCPPATFDSGSERYEPHGETLRYTENLVGGRGYTGTLHKILNHLRSGVRIVYGQVSLDVGPYELINWMPRILGSPDDGVAVTGAGTNASPLVVTTGAPFNLRPFDIMLSRDVIDTSDDNVAAIYRHCGVNRAVLRTRAVSAGQENQEEQTMELLLDIIGFQEHVYVDDDVANGYITWPDPEPALPTTTRLYWVHGDGRLYLDAPSASTEYHYDALNFTIDNNLQAYTRNHNHVTCLQSGGQDFRVQVPTPLKFANSWAETYAARFEGAVDLDFRGTKNLQDYSPEDLYLTLFDFPKVVQRRRTPNTGGRGEIPLWLDLEAYRESTTEPITVTISNGT